MTRRTRIRTLTLVAIALLTALSLVGASTNASSTPRFSPAVALEPDAPPPSPRISYQGRLVDPATGEPKPDGRYDAIFELYNVDVGGTPLWGEKQQIVTSKGLFTVLLGNDPVRPIDPAIFDGYGRWLGVSIDPDGELLPRVRVAHAPYAIYATLAGTAANADRLGGNLPSVFAVVGHTHDTANIASGNLHTDRYHAIDDLTAEGFLGNASGDLALNNGVLQANLNADLLDGQHSAAFAAAAHNHDAVYVNTAGDTMSGTLNVTVPSGGSHGISSITASTASGAAGVEAKNTGTGYGLNAYSASNYGVIASTTATGPGKAGVRAMIGAASGASPSQEAGVWGEVADGYGVAGQSTNSYGVWAYSANSYGLYAAGAGTSAAIYALNSNATGGYGISAASNNSRGIYGSAGGDVAIYGYGTGGYGVYGYSSATTSGYAGVGGYAAATTGSVYGIKGSCNAGSNPSCYAGYFIGPVHVTGLLTKSSGAFKIDHPLDPENKYLYHSFVESPDMLNIYTGNATLDAEGKAWVEMPAWFEALNRDFRYQLTAIGGPGPNLYIAQKIQNNRFQIAGGAAGLEVSWQVTGIRHDPYAEAHRIPVEEDKPAEEKGTYLYPDVYGQPETKAAGFQSVPAPEPAPGEAPGGAPDMSGSPVPAGQSEMS